MLLIIYLKQLFSQLIKLSESDVVDQCCGLKGGLD